MTNRGPIRVDGTLAVSLNNTVSGEVRVAAGERLAVSGPDHTNHGKIEVIGGNYKLVVLGRGHGTVQTDWSGGHVVDVLEAAGNVTSINWRKIPTDSGKKSLKIEDDTNVHYVLASATI